MNVISVTQCLCTIDTLCGCDVGTYRLMHTRHNTYVANTIYLETNIANNSEALFQNIQL